jgi:hypothetical protein
VGGDERHDANGMRHLQGDEITHGFTSIEVAGAIVAPRLETASRGARASVILENLRAVASKSLICHEPAVGTAGANLLGVAGAIFVG